MPSQLHYVFVGSPEHQCEQYACTCQLKSILPLRPVRRTEHSISRPLIAAAVGCVQSVARAPPGRIGSDGR